MATTVLKKGKEIASIKGRYVKSFSMFDGSKINTPSYITKTTITLTSEYVYQEFEEGTILPMDIPLSEIDSCTIVNKANYTSKGDSSTEDVSYAELIITSARKKIKLSLASYEKSENTPELHNFLTQIQEAITKNGSGIISE